MKIVQILPSLDDGGVERGTVDSNRLYLAAGHESWVISAGGKRVAAIEADGGHHVTVDVRSKNPLTALPRMLALRRALRRIRPDVVHFRSRVPGWLTLWANRAKDLRIPVVSTLHGLNHPGFYSSVMMRADRVIAVSTAAAAFIREHYPWVPEARIAVIPRGIDLETFDPARLDAAWTEGFRAGHGLKGRFVAAVIGRVSALKGIDTLIRAAALLKDWPEFIVLVVGGPQKHQEHVFDDLKALAAELGVAERVRFVGAQKHIPEIDALADVVCSCNTKKPESFGRTVAEALAMNTPVIAAAHGGVLDIVRDGTDGYLFPPGDAEALAAALRRIPALPTDGLRGHIEANFTASGMAEATLRVYRGAIDARRRS